VVPATRLDERSRVQSVPTPFISFACRSRAYEWMAFSSTAEEPLEGPIASIAPRSGYV
jgi:hypothetical protein